MSERKMSALDKRSALGGHYASPVWPIVCGFATALILAGVLYSTFKEQLISKRSIVITAPAPAAPIGAPLLPAKPQTK